MKKAPAAGETWNFLDDARGVELTTRLGSELSPGRGQQPPAPPPSLPNLSHHFWSLEGEDTQVARGQDEAHDVIKGRGPLSIDGRPAALEPGDPIFVPRGSHHRFSDVDREGLAPLVISASDTAG